MPRISNSAADLPVLMTEKDAVKCRAFADSAFISACRSGAELPEAFWVALFDKLPPWGTPSHGRSATLDSSSPFPRVTPATRLPGKPLRLIGW